MRVFPEQDHDSGETGGPGLLHALDDQAGGNVDAVEHVADVMQHVGGNFRHASLPRGVEQLLMQPSQPAFGHFPLGDVLRRASRVDKSILSVMDRVAVTSDEADRAVGQEDTKLQGAGFFSGRAGSHPCLQRRTVVRMYQAEQRLHSGGERVW